MTKQLVPQWGVQLRDRLVDAACDNMAQVAAFYERTTRKPETVARRWVVAAKLRAAAGPGGDRLSWPCIAELLNANTHAAVFRGEQAYREWIMRGRPELTNAPMRYVAEVERRLEGVTL